MSLNLKDLMIVVGALCCISGIVTIGLTIMHPNLSYNNNDSFYITQGCFFIFLGSLTIVILTREKYEERRQNKTLFKV